jgi:hypothetical protein
MVYIYSNAIDNRAKKRTKRGGIRELKTVQKAVNSRM